MRRNCYEGPLDGGVAIGEGVGSHAWIDATGRAHEEPGPGRACYCYTFGAWRFAGHGIQQCVGCFCILDPDPATGDALKRCPLCGADQGASRGGDSSIYPP